EAKPGELAGYAVIFYKRTCDGNPSDPIVRLGSHHSTSFGAYMGPEVDVSEYELSDIDSLPKWLEQIKGRLANSAAETPAAAEALFVLNSGGTALLPTIQVSPTFALDHQGLFISSKQLDEN